jgi:hypothetical protein
LVTVATSRILGLSTLEIPVNLVGRHEVVELVWYLSFDELLIDLKLLVVAFID